MRVLVCGGRDFKGRDALFFALNAIHAGSRIGVVIHGNAPGADSLADEWAEVHGVIRLPYPADWAKHGRAAGPIRNALMMRDGKPDLVVAFPGGRGTRNMVEKAREAGVSVMKVGEQ